MIRSPSRSSREPPATVASSYALALRWLAVRDLSAAEVTARLLRRGCPAELVAQTVERLRRTGGIDDERVARSRARAEASGRGRGRQRALLRLRSAGIDRDVAERAVEEVFREVDEPGLLERALARRLRPGGAPIRTTAEYARLYNALVRQGFEPADVARALERHARPGASADDDA